MGRSVALLSLAFVTLAGLLAVGESRQGGAPSRTHPPTGDDWWSLRPLVAPDVPTTPRVDRYRVRTPIDAFVLRGLRAAGLEPSKEAERAVLIRRLTFDLHGLPPTPKEIDAFVDDPDPRAYEKLVDRLLASPRYGERWGRHWLDVVHYADTHGFDKDKPRKNAWPYRDYVIRAFNEDKPYSRFVQEQIAGDLLYPETRDGVVATGFIAAGPWDFVGHTELREGTVDKKITRSLDRDDMLMNAMSTFVSTTAHCARCHDHKFDPIPQTDYYRLQAVFAGVERADRAYPDPKASDLRRKLRSEQADLEKRHAELQHIAASVRSPEIEELDATVAATAKRIGTIPVTQKSPASRTLGYHSQITNDKDRTKWVQVDLGREVVLEGILLFSAHVKFGGHPGPGFGFPPRFRVAASNDPKFATFDTLLDHTTRDHPNPGDEPVAIDGRSTKARYVRVTAPRLWKRTGDWIFALSELVAFSGGKNVTRDAVVTSQDSIEAKPSWSRPNLTDGFTSRSKMANDRDLFTSFASRLTREKLRAQRRDLIDAALSHEVRAERAELEGKLGDVTRRLAALPQPHRVYAAATSFRPIGTFRPAKKTRVIHVLKRGDVKLPGAVVQPGALSAVKGLDGHFELARPQDEGARRVALARWITDEKNPLTWRSIVNRVWQHHFGRGLVTTPSDFGRMGGKPSHPELLDWLAADFRTHDSFKRLHRLILTSSTYRQSSAHRAVAAKKDAGNRLLWRMNRRRLEAEAVRDAVLAVSGSLDLTMGGPAVQHFAFKNDHSPTYDYSKFDVDSKAAHRRSVYRFVVRSVPDPFMERLDCPDASLLTPVRYSTITAPQALALLNNRFMVRQSELFAARLQHLANSPNGQVGTAYRLAFGRWPTRQERAELLAVALWHGRESLARTILNANEFHFVD